MTKTKQIKEKINKNGQKDEWLDRRVDGHAESHRSGLRKTSNKSPLSSKSKSFFRKQSQSNWKEKVETKIEKNVSKLKKYPTSSTI